LRILEDEIRKTILGKLDYHDIYEKRRNVKRLMEERLSPEIRARLDVIGSLADEMNYHAYLVGGFVRDLLLRNKNFDIDIVVEGDGIRFAEELSRQVSAKMRPHKEFGTAKVIYPDGFSVDIATARLEYYKAPATLPIVEHSSLKLDLYRRDFTINTLAISLNKNTRGELIDFFGAQRDIKEKAIRVLHSLSFVEDPTRVFRAVRFERRFNFQIGKFTLNLIKNAIKMGFLARIKGSRMWSELALILKEEDPAAIFKRLQELDLLKFIHPRFTFDADKEKLFREMNTVLKWYTLLYKGKLNLALYYLFALVDHANTKDVTEFGEKLDLSESMRRKLASEIEKTRKVLARFAAAIRTMEKSEIYRELEVLSLEARLFIMAKTQSDETKKAISNYITYADSFKPVLSGKNLKQMGVKEGPIFREILEALKVAKIDRSLATKEQEMEFVHAYMNERGMQP
jgi:tRNA nucleotidyltransferase (CCA-adding enzyme)